MSFDTYHILRGCHKLHNTMVEFSPLPAISRFVFLAIIVEELRHFVAQVTHATFPTSTTLDECDIGIDIRSTTPTASNHCIGHNWDFRFA